MSEIRRTKNLSLLSVVNCIYKLYIYIFIDYHVYIHYTVFIKTSGRLNKDA